MSDDRRGYMEKAQGIANRFLGFGFFIGLVIGIYWAGAAMKESRATAQYDTVYNIHLKGGFFFDNDYSTYAYHYDGDNLVFRSRWQARNMIVPKSSVISITETRQRR